MINLSTGEAVSYSSDSTFDNIMASLFVLVTHHSLTQCEASLEPIIEHLDILCRHPDIDHYPDQRTVLIKMRQLWQTRLFGIQHSTLPH